jgi:hypothetical protein
MNSPNAGLIRMGMIGLISRQHPPGCVDPRRLVWPKEHGIGVLSVFTANLLQLSGDDFRRSSTPHWRIIPITKCP